MTANAYHRPTDLAEALALKASGAMRVAAGCTDLFPATERKVLPGPILDVTAIDDLRGITQEADALRIGATTTWTDLASAGLPASMFALQQAAREVGAVQIQNRGTVAGNLCNASPAADGVPPLLCLDAEVELRSARGMRRLPLAEFVQGPRQTALAADELVTAILVPRRALEGASHFLKLGARKHLVISIAMVAARAHVVDGRIDQLAVAVGSCSAVAVRLAGLERALLGTPADAAAIAPDLVRAALSPIDDVRADAAYRSEAAVALVARAVARALEAAA